MKQSQLLLLIGLGAVAVLTTAQARRAPATATAPATQARPYPLGDPQAPSSRDEARLHPWVLARWRRARDEYRRAYPTAPQPFLTQTFRNRADQERARAAGWSQVGWGGSLHNTAPVLAFDVAFAPGELYPALWQNRFAAIAKRQGLEWGGDWEFTDRPHFQVPDFHGDDLQAGRWPVFPA